MNTISSYAVPGQSNAGLARSVLERFGQFFVDTLLDSRDSTPRLVEPRPWGEGHRGASELNQRRVGVYPGSDAGHSALISNLSSMR